MLACTHFPLLVDRLEALAPWEVAFVDPAPAIARRVDALLGPVGPARRAMSSPAIFTSGAPAPPALCKRPCFGAGLTISSLPEGVRALETARSE